MDKLESITAFVQVVEQGGLSPASKKLSISTTMVGNHIRNLENYLSTKLINRTTRQQNITESGELYYKRCKELLTQIKEMEFEISNLQERPTGLLRISAPIAFGSQYLCPLIKEYMKNAPDVEIQISLSDEFVDLLSDNFDVAIRIGELPDSGLIARPLTPYKLVVCASPEYLKDYGTPVVPDDLMQHDCLSFHSNINKHSWNFNYRKKKYSVPVSGKLCINSGPGLRMAALSGTGIIMQPECIVIKDIHEGKLVQLLGNYNLYSRPMNLIYLPNKTMPLKLRSFINFALKHWE